jgi:hypothetical protein
MASTFSNIGIELITTGEQSGTWGSTTNTNMQIIDRLTNGIGAITLSGTTHTLSTTTSGSATLSDGQYSVLVFDGSPSGTNTVTISPNNVQHVYFIKNASGESVVLTQGSGGNVTIANGKSAIVYADGAGAGAEVVDLTNTFLFQPLTRAVAAKRHVWYADPEQRYDGYFQRLCTGRHNDAGRAQRNADRRSAPYPTSARRRDCPSIDVDDYKRRLPRYRYDASFHDHH